MVDALIGGETLDDVATLASDAVGAPIVIALPTLGIMATPRATALAIQTVAAIRLYVANRVAKRPAEVPSAVTCEVPVIAKDRLRGSVILAGRTPVPRNRWTLGVLHAAAMATLTELALCHVRDQTTDDVRGWFLEQLRAGDPVSASDVVRRADRLGCDVSHGALIVAARPRATSPHALASLARKLCPSALVHPLDGRIYAVIPAGSGRASADAVTALAGPLAEGLRGYAAVGVSAFHANPLELGRAMHEADLFVDVFGDASTPTGDELTGGTFRLLVWLLALRPQEIERFYETTVAPLAAYDQTRRTDLVATLAAYIENDGNITATASAMFAHRHTITYRLDRIRDITNLDPSSPEHRERFSVGLKIRRLIEHSHGQRSSLVS
jgi:sugar diacid utilization regulator